MNQSEQMLKAQVQVINKALNDLQQGLNSTEPFLPPMFGDPLVIKFQDVVSSVTNLAAMAEQLMKNGDQSGLVGELREDNVQLRKDLVALREAVGLDPITGEEGADEYD